MSLSPKAYDLCTAADVASDLGVTADDKVQRVVTAAGAAIRTFCGRTFEKAIGIVENASGYGRPLLLLKRTPVLGITSITEFGAAVAPADYECSGDNANAGMVLRLRGTWLNTRYTRGIVTPSDDAHQERSDLIVATYDAGYVTPGQNAIDSVTYPTISLPEDVQEAAIMTASTLFRRRGIDPDIAGEGIGDWNIQYFATKATAAVAIPMLAQALLMPHVRWSP
jgi:hypothetical protein